MSSDPAREVAIFTEAVKLPPKERVAFLERMCGNDKELQRKLEALLSAHDRLGTFLEGGSNGNPEKN